ncbi:hypothetical protein [Flavobacterium cerinum]|uniref:Uncharacterized protein n=1 Tax=Flavobacterium cerinum TaxID=2502784 RepID=A0A444HFR1_9FLAO|nr:hypothetical protein [Flavobacterium cerinum]RWX03817.1 hypothetical protein EPI11_02480 [Flavobacterium cerinum]
MNLTFPFRNWAYNSLLKFYKVGFMARFSKAEMNIKEWADEDFDVQFYQDRIPSFENELIQIIDTTTQETIDYYFKTLAEDLNYAKQLLKEDYLLEQIHEYNKEKLEKFNELVETKTEEYFKSSNRQKAHLEQYEETIHPFFGTSSMFSSGAKTVQKTNYNFYCIEDKLEYIDPKIIDDYLPFLKEQFELLKDVSNKYGFLWQDGKIKSKAGDVINLKTILFCEGDIDVTLIQKAAEVLNKNQVLENIELRYRGSCNNLDKLWSILTDNNWETVPQKKILLYDCDTNRPDEDFGHIYRRTIPKIETNIIQRGIENLFPKETIEKALEHKKEFVDFKIISGTERGISYEKTETIVNKNEKRNFCNWLLENGGIEDFKHFQVIFDIIKQTE